MKKLTIILFLILLSFTNKVNAQNAQAIFLDNLESFERLANNENESISLNKVYEARKFLIDITGITYKMEEVFDMPVFPPDKTIKKWRSWFEKNKDLLYYDEKEKEVKVRKK
ncbi:hypothetical protein ACHRVW_08330 [Flavobacterium collinsii]|uniref:Uncharacterized protein n=1 Tax=Flavobacterium collinsii TaxID=1114861 RepID=A0A9W4X3C7_9FLAO|nr:hypothetical protein [Flavobacterium collinsii]CAI2767193.1 conserved exported protein of unknown function [Flavobacterium collinsii]